MKASGIFLDGGKRLAFAFESFSLEQEPNFLDLSEKELEIYSKFKSLKRRCEYVFGRRACRVASSELGVTCKNILNENSETFGRGAPFIENSEFIPAISHSHGKVVALVYEKNFSFGVDIERVNPGKISIVKDFFPDSDDTNPIELTILWTLTEALAKALRTGIFQKFDQYRVENLVDYSGFCECGFKNFSEYCGISTYNNEWVASMVFKKEYRLAKDQLIEYMKEWIL